MHTPETTIGPVGSTGFDAALLLSALTLHYARIFIYHWQIAVSLLAAARVLVDRSAHYLPLSERLVHVRYVVDRLR